MRNELIQTELIDFDFHDEILKELKNLPGEKNNPTSVRDMLEEKLTTQLNDAKAGRIVAIIVAFYNFTKGNHDYDFLRDYYKNMFSYYFNAEKIERHFDFIINNDAILNLIINLGNDGVISSLRDAIQRKKLFANGEYRELLEKVEDKLIKSSTLNKETMEALEHFSSNTFSGSDLRKERSRLEAEERSLRFKENARQNAIVSPVADELGVRTQDVIRRLTKKGIDLKTVDSLTLAENIATFNASKVGRIKNDSFKKFVNNIRKANYLRSLRFNVDDTNALTIKSKVTMHDKIASAKRSIVMGISSSAKKAKFGMQATVMMTGALMERLRASFKELSDFYKECYEEAKDNQMSIKAVGANKVGSLPQTVLEDEEVKKIA